jgi:hypothetical protein
MIRTLAFAPAIMLVAVPLNPAAAQEVAGQAIAGGTRLDIVATGEVTRVPDIARISAGVVTLAPTATASIEQNAVRMAAVRAALRRAGIEDRDIQTSSISLNPEYRYNENQPPVLTGYRAGNEVTVRFRDIKNTGRILDALVSQGANQINGPMLGLDKPEAALDEARLAALTTARSRAEVYARSLGKRVRRVLSVSEAGAGHMPMPRPMMRESAQAVGSVASDIAPGEQTIAIALTVSFELE